MPVECQPPLERRPLVLIVAAVIGGLCVGAIVAALLVEDDDEASAGAPPRFASVSDLVRQPAKFFRREVGVSGEVAEVLGPRALVLGGEEFEGGDSLLVVGREAFTTPGARRHQRAVLENDLVDVAGTLRIFDTERLEKRLGVGLVDRLKRFEGEPVLMVEEILVNERLLDLHDPVPIDRIITRPRAYIGVSVRGTVTDVLRGEAFVLDDKLLILAAPLRANSIDKGQKLAVVGGVRRLDHDQLPERGRIDEQLFGELVRTPAIVAESIERR
jgi:hypothetical protein